MTVSGEHVRQAGPSGCDRASEARALSLSGWPGSWRRQDGFADELTWDVGSIDIADREMWARSGAECLGHRDVPIRAAKPGVADHRASMS
jgi:hypothetical protein